MAFRAVCPNHVYGWLKSKNDMEYLIRKQGRYYFRRRVPSHLVEAVGKREIMNALGTADPREAAQRARKLAVETDTLFRTLEANGGDVRSVPEAGEKSGSVPGRKAGIAAAPAPYDPASDPANLASALREEHGQEEHELSDYTPEQYARAWMRDELAKALENVRQSATPSINGSRGSGHTTATPKDTNGAKTLNDALAAWEKQREPTKATIQTMQHVLGILRRAGAPMEVHALTTAHVRAMVAATADKSLATRKAYLSLLKALLSAAVSAEVVDKNVAESVKIEGKASTVKARIPFAVDEIQRICDRLPESGAHRWLFLVSLYSGARMSEIGQLTKADFKKEHWRDANGKEKHSWVMYITEEAEEARLKNQASVRRVPVHSKLIELGFMDLVHKADGPLFPELKRDKLGRITANFGKAFSVKLRSTYGVTDTRKTFHSLRHNVKDALREAGVREDVADRITGHTTGSVARGYGSEFFPLRPLCEGVERIEYHGLKL